MEGARDVDAYLAGVPEDKRDALEELRELVKAAAPESFETISYGIPTFNYQGPLVAFSASRNHCGFHLMSPAVMEAFREELEPYKTGTATVRFTPAKPLPAALVKRLVKARMAENRARKAAGK